MNLPHGITGFWSSAPLTPLDEKEWRRTLYALCRASGMRLVSLDADLIDKNFYCAALTLPHGGTMYLLRNVFSEYAALASDVAGRDIAFIDAQPELSALLPEVAFLNPGDLAEAIGSTDALDKAEIAQLRDWQPHSVGEVIFNRWD